MGSDIYPDWRDGLTLQSRQAAQDAVDAVAYRHLGGDREVIHAALRTEFALRGLDIPNEQFLNQVGELIARGQAVLVGTAAEEAGEA